MAIKFTKKMSDKNSIDRLKKASMQVDDFVWFLQKIDSKSLKEASEVLRDFLVENESGAYSVNNLKSKNQNKHFLIGVLPRLFQDKDIFPQNEDIVDFAREALGLRFSRAGKRSRYEIIGKVVCETDTLDDTKLHSLVLALERILDNREIFSKFAEKRKVGSFSWNETIQELLKL